MVYKSRFVIASLAWAILLCLCPASGQRQNEPPKNVAGIPVNYDESLAGSYTLPDPLVLSDGKRVRDAKTWYRRRRPRLCGSSRSTSSAEAPAAPRA